MGVVLLECFLKAIIHWKHCFLCFWTGNCYHLHNVTTDMIYFLYSSARNITTQVYLWITWWRHQMETFSALVAICAGNAPVTGEFPTQRPVTRSFDVFFDMRPNKRLGKQSWGWGFDTPSRPLWRHCNDQSMLTHVLRAILKVGRVRMFEYIRFLHATIYICYKHFENGHLLISFLIFNHIQNDIFTPSLVLSVQRCEELFSNGICFDGFSQSIAFHVNALEIFTR